MKSFPLRIYLGLCVAAIAIPATAAADVVWPALMLETRLFSWWAISAGLIVEFAAVKWLWKLRPGKAIMVTLSANLLSTLLGIALIPIAGVVWEVFPGLVFYYGLGVGTFNPITWAATFVIAVCINTALEMFVICLLFKYPYGKNQTFGLMAANAVSVGLAFASLFIYPVPM